jgi:hypothetical protein
MNTFLLIVSIPLSNIIPSALKSNDFPLFPSPLPRVFHQRIQPQAEKDQWRKIVADKLEKKVNPSFDH